MITPESARGAYARALRDEVTIERGTERAAAVRCQVRSYGPTEIVGSVMQGDQEVILFKPDLDNQGFPSPPKKGDKIKMENETRTTTVEYCDPNTRRVGTETIAYVVQTRG